MKLAWKEQDVVNERIKKKKVFGLQDGVVF